MKRETILSILLNVAFVLCVFGIRYFYVKKEYNFLKDDSQRQETLIENNELTIDTLKTEVAKLNKYNVKLINQIQKIKEENFERIRWEKEYEQRLKNLIEELEAMRFDFETSQSNVVPFQKDFGEENSYLRIFGRSGIRIKDNKVISSETIADFDGTIELGAPEIQQIDEYEYQATYPNKQFYGLKLRGAASKVLSIKPPRNQISFGPMIGVTYNQVTGLTEPIWGFGITYNLVKLIDWR